jgi:hypothetical protein
MLSFRVAPLIQLAVFPLCILPFSILNVIVIKLLGQPYPVVKLSLLNLIGPEAMTDE